MFATTDFPSTNSLKNKNQIKSLRKGKKPFFPLIAKLLLYLKILSEFKALREYWEALCFHLQRVYKVVATSTTSPVTTMLTCDQYSLALTSARSTRGFGSWRSIPKPCTQKGIFQHKKSPATKGITMGFKPQPQSKLEPLPFVYGANNLKIL